MRQLQVHSLYVVVLFSLLSAGKAKPALSAEPENDQVTVTMTETGTEKINVSTTTSTSANKTEEILTTTPAHIYSESTAKDEVLHESTVSTTTPSINPDTMEVPYADENENVITDADMEYRKQYAAKMLSYMNRSMDPCDDFYEYACGNWKTVIEDRQASHKRNNLLDIIYTLGDAVEKLLTKSAESLELDYADELKLAKQFYETCLVADLYPMKLSQDYLRVINSIGGFPAVDASWNASNFSWFNMSAHLTNYGAEGLINEEVLPQYPFNPYFKLPELGFDYIVHSDNIATNATRGYKLNEKRMRDYLKGYDISADRITQVISGIFDFWHEVLELADRFDEDEDKCDLLTVTLSEGPFKQWRNFFEIAWRGIEFDVPEDDCPCDYFYEELDKICEKHKPDVANYLAMKFLYAMDAKLKATRYQKDYCIMHTQFALPYLLDKLYLNEYFTEETRGEVITIVKELRKSLRYILENADWLDPATRGEALKKESTIISRVGSFQDHELTEKLIREMNNLTFVDGNYELNNLNLRRFSATMRRYNGYHLGQLPNTTKPLELLVGMQVNAFYYNVDNSINVMAGILHPPAYHKSWPHSLKYGTLGYLIGHEFTHGFDTVGAMFDSIGDVNYWWSKKSQHVFDVRANCFVDHYNQYLIPEINRKVNGNQTKDENIADGGGLREALRSYRRFIKQLSNDTVEGLYALKNELMPGMEHSPEQLFFLGFAQLWCASYEEEHYWEELTNEHTMDKYRVLGAVTNNEDFSKVYNCPLGSKMNPTKDKCHLW